MVKFTANQLHQMASHLSAIAFRWEIDDIINHLPRHDPFKAWATTLLNHPTHRYHPLFQIQFCECWANFLTSELIDYAEKSTLSFPDHCQQKNYHWDQQSAVLSQTEQNALLTIAHHLQSQPKLQWLAENLGKSATDEPSTYPKKSTSTEPIPTPEIDSWQFSDDLGRLLPQETILLADEDLEWLFYAKWAEKNLLTYDHANQNSLIKTNHSPSIKRSPPIPKGPWLLAIDASGSMIGQNELQTKAFAYGLILEAISENRPCHLLIFSTTTIEFTFSSNGDWLELLHFLSYEFHGGTNFNVLLDRCFQQLEHPTFKLADVLILSDFIAPELPIKQHKKLKKLEKQHRFFALNVSPYANDFLLRQFHHHENNLISKWRNF
jgi:uncharacterized protein with von Willebrand factor type A (vWA) domain